MQNLVNIYNKNKNLILPFIHAALQQIDLNLSLEQIEKKLYKSFPSLELVYTTDENCIQDSQNIYRSRREDVADSQSRKYLLKEEGKEFFVSEPYISVATDHLCVTVVCRTQRGYLFLDLRVRYLLERFDLIETKKGMNLVNKLAYACV